MLGYQTKPLGIELNIHGIFLLWWEINMAAGHVKKNVLYIVIIRDMFFVL